MITALLVSMFPTQSPVAQGYVFEDKNGNAVMDRGERGLSGVKVSDQYTITRTDSRGHWQLPLRGDDVRFFVIKPRGWMTPVDEHQLPQFYYNHKPAGSKKTHFPGVAPTGPLPKSINFALHKQKEPDQFTALFFGDTQPRDVREVDYIRRDVVTPLIGKTDAAFGITLGDIVFNDLSVFEPYIKTIALLDIPWYNVLGNHDVNFDIEHDHESDETFERYFGPNYYSFDHGPVHFVVLDDVWMEKAPGAERANYTGQFGPDQIAWLKKDLSLLPKDQLVVLTMHIPLTSAKDRQAVFDLLEQRPYSLSVSAHTHMQEHIFIGKEGGFDGKKPHHHVVNVTVCGSWWSGDPDEYGIPHTTMRDGAPNGYSIFSFDGNQYSIEFRAARRPASYQMEITVPDFLLASEAVGTDIYANVFGGSTRSKVEIRIGEGPWQEMVKVEEKDPAYLRMWEVSKTLKSPYRVLSAPENSSHLWKSRIEHLPDRGMLPIHVRTTDMFGQTYMSTKGVRIL